MQIQSRRAEYRDVEALRDLYRQEAACQIIRDSLRRGFGSYLVQEVKRFCYAEGRRPTAQCDVGNVGSRRTLERQGYFPAGGCSWAKSLRRPNSTAE
jgi:hypothetical protein